MSSEKLEEWIVLASARLGSVDKPFLYGSELAAAEILRLRAELADAKRAAWIAGRNAAASVVRGHLRAERDWQLASQSNDRWNMDGLEEEILELAPPA